MPQGERPESQSEMPMVMRKRTAAFVTELDERTKTKKPRMVVDKHDDAHAVKVRKILTPYRVLAVCAVGRVLLCH